MDTPMRDTTNPSTVDPAKAWDPAASLARGGVRQSGRSPVPWSIEPLSLRIMVHRAGADGADPPHQEPGGAVGPTAGRVNSCIIPRRRTRQAANSSRHPRSPQLRKPCPARCVTPARARRTGERDVPGLAGLQAIASCPMRAQPESSATGRGDSPLSRASAPGNGRRRGAWRGQSFDAGGGRGACPVVATRQAEGCRKRIAACKTHSETA